MIYPAMSSEDIEQAPSKKARIDQYFQPAAKLELQADQGVEENTDYGIGQLVDDATAETQIENTPCRPEEIDLKAMVRSISDGTSLDLVENMAGEKMNTNNVGRICEQLQDRIGTTTADQDDKKRMRIDRLAQKTKGH